MPCQANPQSTDQLVELVEGHLVAQGVLRSSRLTKAETSTCPKGRQRTEDPAQGLIVWNFPRRKDAPMPTASASEAAAC